MANTLQIKRGTKANLPALAAGEFGLATDTNELFVGNSGNLQVATMDSSGSLLAPVQGSAPANPGAGFVKLYALADRIIFVFSDGDTITLFKDQT